MNLCGLAAGSNPYLQRRQRRPNNDFFWRQSYSIAPSQSGGRRAAAVQKAGEWRTESLSAQAPFVSVSSPSRASLKCGNQNINSTFCGVVKLVRQIGVRQELSKPWNCHHHGNFARLYAPNPWNITLTSTNTLFLLWPHYAAVFDNLHGLCCIMLRG